LCATLTRPTSPGPHAGLVLIHGSGPIDRDETLPGTLMLEGPLDQLDGALDNVIAFSPPVAVFRDLARELAVRGVAVLRYDKRSYLAARGSPCGPTPARGDTLDDLAADAAAAVAALRGRPEIDPEHVFVLGHSQGAGIALALLAGDQRLRGGLILAGPAGPIDAVVLGQLRDILAYREALPPTAVNLSAVAALRGVLADAEQKLSLLRAGGSFAGDLIGLSSDHWATWLALGDRTELLVRSTPQPLLFLAGSVDYNIRPAELEVFRRWAKPADTLVLVEGVPHSLNDVTPSGYGSQVSARVLAELARFLENR
jgi:uncharacterized protein